FLRARNHANDVNMGVIALQCDHRCENGRDAHEVVARASVDLTVAHGEVLQLPNGEPRVWLVSEINPAGDDFKLFACAEPFAEARGDDARQEPYGNARMEIIVRYATVEPRDPAAASE